MKDSHDAQKNPRIFIVAGEASGDLHAAGLIRAIRERAPEAEFFGLGGEKMEAAGCKLLARTTGIALMFFSRAFAKMWTFLGMLSAIDRHFVRRRPDVVVLIDSPGFNFPVASRARFHQIPVLYYVPPQLWAWAPWRVKKLRRRVTRVACVFRHEEEFFHEHGVDATFVGHPLAEHLRNVRINKSILGAREANEKLVCLFPGSRSQEIHGILPKMLRIAGALKARLQKVRFAMGCPNEEIYRLARPLIEKAPVKVQGFVGQTNSLMAAADLGIVASGTATLELAWYGTPMVVLYPIPRIRGTICAKLLVKTKRYSLPNIIAGRDLVPEFILYWGPDEPIINEALSLLTNAEKIKATKQGLKEVRDKFDVPGASDRTAKEVLDLIGTPVPAPPPLRPGFAM